MILTAHQSKYLPWLGLFHKIALSTHFVHYDQVQYQKKNFLNKNFIKGTNGERLRLTVPVQTSGLFHQNIAETRIDNNTSWARKHWKSMQVAYAKAPYFKRYESFFEDTYAREWEYLVHLNRHLLEFFLNELSINCEHVYMQEGQFAGAGSDMVLDMCRKLGAQVYIFGSGGKGYADQKDFTEANIDLWFQEYNHPHYPQLHGEFYAGMSIVDLLFNCGDRSFEILMDGNPSHIDHSNKGF